MHTATSLSVVLLSLAIAGSSFAENVLFEDAFESGLSGRWTAVGLAKGDYRVRNGGLEMRVQPGKMAAAPPMLKVILPFSETETAIVSVQVTLVDDFTQDGQFAGVYLIDEAGLEFGAKKERFRGKLFFSPGNYQFNDKAGPKGDAARNTVTYTVATPEDGPLRIIVDRGNAFFQVGPDPGGKYLNFFHSALRTPTKERGFALIAAGAPEGPSQWVRFDDFRVVKH